MVQESKMNSTKIGQIVQEAILLASTENRVIVGLSAAVKALSKTPEDFLFCFLAPPDVGDSATHMHEVLLEAYCYEHDIYIIKVDSSQKLSQLMGSQKLESCALVQKRFLFDHSSESLTDVENELVNHCEEIWNIPSQEIICLPESLKSKSEIMF